MFKLIDKVADRMFSNFDDIYSFFLWSIVFAAIATALFIVHIVYCIMHSLWILLLISIIAVPIGGLGIGIGIVHGIMVIFGFGYPG